MNQENRARIGKTIALTAEYYGRELKREVISMMVDDLIDLPLNDVLKAYDRYRQDHKNRTMPLPAQIMAILNPVLDPDNAAREILGRILDAQARFGYTWPKEAREHVGEIGWGLVTVYGGWQNFCQGLGVNFSFDSFNAQGREFLKGRIIHGGKISEKVNQLEGNTVGQISNGSGEVLQLNTKHLT